MQQWNPSSVNSIRIFTFLNKRGLFIITPYLRVGRKGSVTDNAGSGGIFACIDYHTGVVTHDGYDEMCKVYPRHPDTELAFKGWQIPRWQELLEEVEQIHRTNMSNHVYIAWDFALTDNGWVLIEGNWGQNASQYADHIGLKKKFIEYIN